MTTFWDRLVDDLFWVDTLPTFPAVILELEEALGSNESDAARVAAIMERDPSLTANALRLANSAFYRGAAEIDTVQLAVARIGFAEIGKLTTALHTLCTYTRFVTHLNHRVFWQRCVMRGFVSRHIARAAGDATPLSVEQALVAGLLQDIGLLVLDQFFSEEYTNVTGDSIKNACTIIEAEQAALGVDHGEIGGYLLERWNLPAHIVDAVAWRFQVSTCPLDKRAAPETLRLADALCAAHEDGTLNADDGSVRDELTSPMLGLEHGDLEEVLGCLDHESKQSAALIAMA